jgi:heme A synthase
MVRLSRFARYAWAVLAYNVLVVLWGTYVRATGSGAGCGSHWPLCQGVVVPQSPQAATVIEFIHRASSGVVVVLAAGMILWAWRAYPRGDAVRLGAALVGIFTLTEALLGAALVLFGWVALNQSVQRAVSVAGHLVNTFLLLAALAFTARAASGGSKVTVRGQGWPAWGLGLGLLAMLALGTSGAVTALGDTLFPSGSLAQGVQQDFAPTAHLLIRLRIFHPLIAIAVTAYLLGMGNLVLRARPGAGSRRLLSALTAVLLVQLVAGAVNVALLAPVWMQLLHLFIADLTWLTTVLLAASFLAAKPGMVRQDVEDAPEAQEARRNALSAS